MSKVLLSFSIFKFKMPNLYLFKDSKRKCIFVKSFSNKDYFNSKLPKE